MWSYNFTFNTLCSILLIYLYLFLWENCRKSYSLISNSVNYDTEKIDAYLVNQWSNTPITNSQTEWLIDCKWIINDKYLWSIDEDESKISVEIHVSD